MEVYTSIQVKVKLKDLTLTCMEFSHLLNNRLIMSNLYVVKPKYDWALGMLRYDQILPRNGQLLQDMAKIWVGMPKYGQIVPYYAKIWSNLSCHALRYFKYGQVMVIYTRK